MSKKSKSTAQAAKPAPKKSVDAPKPAPVKVVKPAVPAKQQSGKPSVTPVKPLTADLSAKKQPAKGLDAGHYRPMPLKPVGKHMHWLADSRARDVLRVADDMPWIFAREKKGQGSLRSSLNSVLAHGLDLEEDDLREILTLRKKGRGLFRQVGMLGSDEVITVDEAFAYPDLFMLDLGVFSTAEQLLAQLPNSETVEGRQVIFLMHGLGASQDGAYETYQAFYDNYRAQWEMLPESERPIIVGVSWDSQVGVLFTPNQAVTLGSAIDSFQESNPSSPISLIAHSMGTVLAANVVQNSSARFDEVLLLQGIVSQEGVENSFTEL
jgi:hypothetical protein